MGLLSKWFKKQQKSRLEEVLTKKEPEKAASVGLTVEKKAAPRVKNAGAGLAMKDALIRPLVTEKSATGESGRKYSFIVERSADKPRVKHSVEARYGTKVESVNISNIQGKQVRFGRVAGRRSDYKKAVVTLAPGESISLHSGV